MGVVAITSRAADSAAMTKAAMIAFSPSRLFFFFSTTSLPPGSSREVHQHGCSFVFAAHGGTECWHGMSFPTLPVWILRLTGVDELARYCCDLVLRCCDLLGSLQCLWKVPKQVNYMTAFSVL